MQGNSIDLLMPPYTDGMKTGRPIRQDGNGFGKRLVMLREKKGLSQSQLAKAMDVSQGSVARWEKRSVAMPPEQIIKLAHVLGVSTSELLGEKDMPKEASVPRGRMRQVFYAAAKLPRRQQEKIVDVVEAFVDKKTASK